MLRGNVSFCGYGEARFTSILRALHSKKRKRQIKGSESKTRFSAELPGRSGRLPKRGGGKLKHACKRTLAFLLMLAMVLTMMPVTAMAAADGDRVVVQLVGKDGTVSDLATWKYDGTNKTYIDLDTNGELALVKDFTDSENLKGSINGQSYDFTDLGALAYTGTNKKPDCRCLAVTTKGILIEDLYNYAGSKLGKKGTVETLKDDGTTLIFSSADNRGTNPYNYSEYWGATKYYYPAWYEGGEQSEGLVSETLQANGRIVPSTLAICGYHATTGETVSSLKEKSDDANALRNTQGQQKGGAEKATDANMGFNSVRDIAYIKFTPTYNAITVDGGTVSGTEGDSDYQAAVTNAVVTTSDNYFKAAKGETVALTVTAESGYAVTGITVTAGENTEGIPVAKTSKNTYTFTMPGEAVALAVETGKATKVDWYGDGTAKEYTLSTKEDLQSFAAIVNGTAPGIEQDNFRGKTVKLAKSIALDADNKYTHAVGTFGSPAYPMADAPYYTINADAEIWTPIGKGTATDNTDATTDNAFAGTFDGCGYTVSGVYTGTKDASAGNTETVQGFFGVVTGTVKNLTVSGCITGKFVVGGIAASLNGGTIENCKNNAIVYADGGQAANSGIENGTKNAGAVGGIAGNVMTGSSVTGCVNNAAVVCTNSSKGGRAGGIIGLIDDASAAVTVKNNGNKGRIDAYQYSGGIVGYNNSANAPIENCYNNGDIFGYSSGRTCVGGIVSTCKSDITNCYNTGDIEIHLNSEKGTKAAQFGGIVADFGGTAITNCYNTGELKATGTAAGNRSGCGAICGSGYGSADENKMVNCYSPATVTDTDNIAENLITVKSAEEMKTAEFVKTLGSAFAADKNNINNGYPVLAWQNPAKPSSGGSGGGSDVQMPSVTAGDGGKTSLSKDGRTLTITPDEGYEIASVTLNGTEKGTSGTLTGLKTGDKVVVVFQKKVVQTEKRFNDVNDGDWFNDAVNYAADKGLMTGTGEKTFSPYSNTTRAMLMTILARMSGEDTTGGATWYRKGLEWAVANGVSDGTNPEKNITREQLAVMLYRYAGSPDTTGSLAAFKDADSVSDYAKTAVKWAVEKGIITGKGGGMLDPKSDATRAEMAAMLQRYCQLMEK